MHKLLLIPMHVYGFIGQIVVHLLDMMIQKGLVLFPRIQFYFFWGGGGIGYIIVGAIPLAKVRGLENQKKKKKKKCIISNIA
jgi:hypothetical protein